MQPVLLAAWARGGWMVAHARESSSHSSFCTWWLCPAPLRTWAVAEAVCPKCPPMLPKHAAKRLKNNNKKTNKKSKPKWIPTQSLSWLETVGQVFISYKLAQLHRPRWRCFDLQQCWGAARVFPSVTGKSVCISFLWTDSEPRLSPRSKPSTVLTKEASHQQFNNIKFHIFSF